jgi:glycosyltransferase involved in cell wall biosynthesis
LNLRVGIIVDNPIIAAAGYSIRPRELAENLAKIGCVVYIFSPVDRNMKLSENVFVKGIPNWQELFTRKFYRSLRKAFKCSFTAQLLYKEKMLKMISKRLARNLLAKVKDCKIDVLQGETEIPSMAAIIIGKSLGIPVVADIHGLLVEEAIQYGFFKEGSEKYHETRAFASQVLHEADGVVVASENLGNFLKEDFSIDASKVFSVPNAARPKEVIKPIRPTLRNLVYAGILEPWERVDLAVDSMVHVVKQNAEASLQIAGGGSLEKNLIKHTSDLTLNNNVTFNGTIEYQKVAGFLVQSDIAVLPSTVDIVREVACPLKLFEYLSVGLPVVTVDGLWWSDFIRSHKVGLVAAKDGPESFANAISELLLSPEKTNEMSKNAVHLINNEYNWFEMSKRLLRVFERID